MEYLDIFSLIASLATAVGVLLLAYQIYIARQESVTQLEDSMAKEYRDLASAIPTRALLGVALTEEEKNAHFDEFFHYFDLSNEQTFLRQKKRIRKETWIFWCDGMKSNIAKPAFSWAWEEIEKTGTKEFSEFRRLVASGFAADPATWQDR